MDENRNRYIIFNWEAKGRTGLERPNVDGNIEIYVNI
jgi:hypothetical protein